ncbi:MAG: HlyD family efflux transporter periplasmic adaptor subunit [Candidatus Vogelbacteria bacterium]|nr:HlyD family efflux transporter periplasmic adaptor subunit [Candidatus Vogelbacteria bacterium]
MKEKLDKSISYLKDNITKTGSILIVLTILAAGSVYAAQSTGTSTATETTNKTASKSETTQNNASAVVGIVGGDLSSGTPQLTNSWPGEIISYGNIPIQPAREGTIVEWKVKIGDRVSAGQTLARLSTPPAMPDLIGMLAEQAENLARMKAQSETTRRFVEANNKQLQTLLLSNETNATAKQDILRNKDGKTGSAQLALEKSREAALSMRRNLRTMLEQMLNQHMNTVSGVKTLKAFRFNSLNRAYGINDPQNQDNYEMKFIRLASALGKDPESIPTDLASDYLASFVRLANTTVVTNEVMSIEKMAREDQETFFDMLADYKDAEADTAMNEVEYAVMSVETTNELSEQKKMIEEKIAENEKMLSMAEAEAIAAEAAYSTVNNSVNGGLSIVATRSGVVSTINKKVGDFVEPGMPVASINTDTSSEKFVRLQIPSNVRTPKTGTILSVSRPGFPENTRKVKLTGVGTSLDTTGSYMADASFMTPVDWPTSASVRVYASTESTVPVIKLSSVWWDVNGSHKVWKVSEVGRIFSVQVKLGRTLGSQIEVYEGLKNGDRYIIYPTPNVREDMLLDEIMGSERENSNADGAFEKKPMGGMEM